MLSTRVPFKIYHKKKFEKFEKRIKIKKIKKIIKN